jgi:CheY-like chemotaxis protein
MPKMDGRKALGILKSDPELRKIPVVILTTSKAEEDILKTYDLGANSFITKPIDFNNLVIMMGSLKRYWLEIVELPPAEGN